MPLRVLKPVEPTPSYGGGGGGGGGGSDVSAAFDMSGWSDRRDAKRFRDEQFAFEKDVANRRLQMEQSRMDSLKEHEAAQLDLEKQAFGVDKAYKESLARSQDPMKQAEARDWETQKVEERAQALRRTRLGLSVDAPYSDVVNEEIRRAAVATSVANEISRRTTAGEYFQDAQGYADLNTYLTQMETGFDETGQTAPIGTRGYTQRLGAYDPLDPDSLPPINFTDVRSPEDVRAYVDQFHQDPTKGTPFEHVGGKMTAALMSARAGKAMTAANIRMRMHHATKAVETTFDYLNRNGGGIDTLVTQADQAMEQHLESMEALSNVGSAVDVAARNYMDTVPSLVNGIFAESNGEPIMPDQFQEKFLEKLFSSTGRAYEVIKNPALANDDKHPFTNGPGLYATLGYVRAAHISLSQYRNELESKAKGGDAKAVGLLPAVQGTLDYLGKVGTSLQTASIGDTFTEGVFSNALKIATTDQTVKSKYATGDTNGVIDRDVATQILHMRMAGDPTAASKLQEKLITEGKSVNPAFEDSIPDSPTAIPLYQSWMDLLRGTGAYQFVPVDQMSRAGFSGRAPTDAFRDPFFGMMGYPFSGDAQSYFDSAELKNRISYLQQRDKETQEQHRAMQQRLSNLDVSKARGSMMPPIQSGFKKQQAKPKQQSGGQ